MTEVQQPQKPKQQFVSFVGDDGISHVREVKPGESREDVLARPTNYALGLKGMLPKHLKMKQAKPPEQVPAPTPAREVEAAPVTMSACKFCGKRMQRGISMHERNCQENPDVKARKAAKAKEQQEAKANQETNVA